MGTLSNFTGSSIMLIYESRNDPLVQYEFEEIKAAIGLDRTVMTDIG